MSRGYRTVDVVRLSGASYRQLDYWDLTGYLVPSVRPRAGTGGPVRLYSEADVAKARLTMFLMGCGVSLQQMRRDGDPAVTASNLLDALEGLDDRVGVA